MSDGINAVEKLGFLEFFSGPGTQLGEIPKDLTLWVDNEAAIKSAVAPEPTKKTRHYVLRYMKVREFEKPELNRFIRFCRTDLQKADSLTKDCNEEQRKLTFGRWGSGPISSIW